jgi:hypothetical protein
MTKGKEGNLCNTNVKRERKEGFKKGAEEEGISKNEGKNTIRRVKQKGTRKIKLNDPRSNKATLGMGKEGELSEMSACMMSVNAW